jgi:anti-anti-sigma regulatory factor
MRTFDRGDTLLITEIPTLTSGTSRAFKEYAHGSLRPEHKFVEVDLSRARTVDSEGLGALISVHKAICERGGRVRLHQPDPLIAGLFTVLKLDHMFDIIPR